MNKGSKYLLPLLFYLMSCLKNSMYSLMPSVISLSITYSSAPCERADSPTPIFSDGISCMSAMSEVVGDTKVLRPIAIAAFTNGCSEYMADACTRVLRSFASASSNCYTIFTVSSLE